MSKIKEVLIAPPWLDAQSAMWAPFEGRIHWTILAVLAALAALVLSVDIYIYIRRLKWLGGTDQKIDALTRARMMWLGGLIMIACNQGNSAMQAWCVDFFVGSSLWMALLMRTGWCHRRGTSRERLAAIAREWRTVIGLHEKEKKA